MVLRALTVALRTAAAIATVVDYDLVVYDATPGGVTAAVAAGRHGLRTALLCASWPACYAPSKRVGGMSSGGLGQTDIGSHTDIIGGLALEFYQRNRAHYGGGAEVAGQAAAAAEGCRLPTDENGKCNATFNLEPHVARGVFEAMLATANVSVLYEAAVESVAKSGAVISAITLIDGRKLSAPRWIDASYEGDLFARAGVSYATGRESKAAHNESLAGRTTSGGNEFSVVVDPYDASGQPIPLMRNNGVGPGVPGQADKKVPSYNFRLCLTQNASNMLPWPKPANYDPRRFELVRRFYNANGGKIGSEAKVPSCNNAPVPNGKTDMNNCGGVASDFIGGSWTYPDANYTQRRAIWAAHRDYQQGLHWTCAHDPAMPAAIRASMAKWGLCKDEFVESGGWPPALYVREARRLQGAKLFTQNTPTEQRSLGAAGLGNLSLGLGNYNFDSHNVQRFACKSKGACQVSGIRGASPTTAFAWDEGDVQIAPGVYQIPFWVLTPKPAECSNLLVVGAPSATHIGMSTLRMEPQYMILGHAAGAATALSLRSGKHYSELDMDELHAMLVADGQKLASNETHRPVKPGGGCKAYSALCARGKCIPQTVCASKAKPAACAKSCAALAPNEWLANTDMFRINATSVTAPKATFLKKGEAHSSLLPAAEKKAVGAKTTLQLSAPPVDIDAAYSLVTLA